MARRCSTAAVNGEGASATSIPGPAGSRTGKPTVGAEQGQRVGNTPGSGEANLPWSATVGDPGSSGTLTHAGAPRAASMMRAISTSEPNQPTLAVPSKDTA